MRHPPNLSPDLLNPRKERKSRTFGGAQSRRDEAQRLGSAAPLSIFRAAPIAKWQQAAGLPKNAFTSNGITALGLLPFHQKCGTASKWDRCTLLRARRQAPPVTLDEAT